MLCLLLLACGESITYSPDPADSTADTADTSWLLESDWCEPNPCDQLDRQTCRVAEAEVICLCDAGFMEDAEGACIEEVCLPSPCDVAGGTACDGSSGAAECGCEDSLQRDTWGRCVLDAEECQDPAANPTLVVETGGYAVHLAPVVGADGTSFVPQLGRAVMAVSPDGSTPWNPRYDYTAASPLAIGADGGIYTHDQDGLLHVIHPDDGRDWWTWPTGATATARPAPSPDGPVYMGSSDGVLHAVEAAQGSWTREFRNAVDVRPAVGSTDEAYALALVVDEGSWASALYRLDPSNGDIEWKLDPETLTLAIGSPTVLSDGTVVVAAGTSVVGASPEGDLAWTVTLPAAAASEAVSDGSGGMYVVAGASLCRFEVGAEEVAWCLDEVTALTRPGVAQQRHAVIAGPEGGLHLVSPEGERVWELGLGGALTATTQAPDGSLRVGSSEGVLYGLSFCGPCTQTWCDGDQLMGCREDGLGMQGLEDCSGSGASCVDGACRVEGARAAAWRACTEEGASWFDAQGEASTFIEACEFAEHCVQGTCVGCWSQREVGCSDESTVAIFDECGNREQIVEVCNTDLDGCVDGRCVPCHSHDDRICVDGAPTWVDACGRLEEADDPCGGDEVCEDGECVACASHADKVCHDGHPWWVDACDNREEQAETCGFYDACEDGECVEDCYFLSCSAASYAYTCAAGVSAQSCTYDGPGPNGLDACTTTYDNGHEVVCTWTAETTGSCVDDTDATCEF